MSESVPAASPKATAKKRQSSLFAGIAASLSRRNWKVIAFFTYCILLIVITVFHEPWYDEAQAWMIARTATLKDILFSIPHYEGHPPLWHLLLFPFARLSLPYEVCIKSISILIAVISIWILIFCSPFPQSLKLSLPFTYFLFYQYAVISRPYCILFLAFALAACTYPRRNKKPFPFVFSLILLCLASSYGIVMAGGIALAWLYELWDGDRIPDFVKRMLHSRQLPALLLLLASAVVLILTIFPAADANGVNMEDISKGLFARFLYMFFVAPLDALFFQSMGYGALVWQQIPTPTFVAGILLGILVFAMLVLIGIRARKLPLLLIPYTLYAYFCARVYFWTHHIGILLLFLIFWLWCCAKENNGFSRILPKNRCLLYLYQILALFSVAMSILWNVTACYADIRNNYGHGRTFKAFIEENHLEDCSMMISWEHNIDPDTRKTTLVDVANCTLGIGILPYFSSNPFYNFREGQNSQNYSLNMLPDKTRSQKIIEHCRAEGLPQIVVGDAYFEDIFEKADFENVFYVPVACIDDNYIWKNKIYESSYYVYMRQGLANELGMVAVPVEE